MFKLVLEKAEEPEIKLPTSARSWKKQESSRKTSISALLTMQSLCVDHNKLANSERDGNTRPPELPLEKSVCRSGSNSQNWTWNNRLVANRKRSTSRLYIVTLLISLLCRVHREKRWAGRSTSWNQDFREKYQSPQICRWHHLYGRKWKGAKKPLDERKEESEKVGLKLNIQKTKIMALVPSLHGK